MRRLVIVAIDGLESNPRPPNSRRLVVKAHNVKRAACGWDIGAGRTPPAHRLTESMLRPNFK